MMRISLSLIAIISTYAHSDPLSQHPTGWFADVEAGYNIYDDGNLNNGLRSYVGGIGGGDSFDYFLLGNQLGLRGDYQFTSKAKYNDISGETSLINLDIELKRFISDGFFIVGRVGAAYWDTDRTQTTTISASGVSPHVTIGFSKSLFENAELGLFYNYVHKVGDNKTLHTDLNQLLIWLRWCLKNKGYQSTEPVKPRENQVTQTTTVQEPTPFDETGTFKSRLVSESFRTGSSRLLDTSALREIVDIMSQYPSSNVRIIGHTDSVGSSDSNMKLSVALAQSVSSYLERYGINKNRRVDV